MKLDRAIKVCVGHYVLYRGRLCRVNSIKVRSIAVPLFRLEGVVDGLTSYRLCGYVDPAIPVHEGDTFETEDLSGSWASGS